MEHNLPGIFQTLTGTIGKTKEEIISTFSQSARQLIFNLNEMWFNGYVITSKGYVWTDMGDYDYKFCFLEEYCRSVRIYIGTCELHNACFQFCTDNYLLVTDNTWIIPGEAILLFLYEYEKEEGVEVYFESMIPQNRYVCMHL